MNVQLKTRHGRGRLIARLAAPVMSIVSLALLLALAAAPAPQPETLPLADDEIELAAYRVAEGHTFEPVPWVTPVAGGYEITATFGATGLWSSAHTGLDFAAPEGAPVQSAAAGTVTEVGYDGAYGNKVVVTRDDGTEIWYCHLSTTAVAVGQTVAPGTAIGGVGSTGNVTGPHLHLEIHPGGGDPADPYAFLADKGVL